MYNIEKSIFRKGEYVGYGNGAWRIVRNSKQWLACDSAHDRPMLRARTLRELSALLETQRAPFESTISKA
jgi:hypothetical protein